MTQGTIFVTADGLPTSALILTCTCIFMLVVAQSGAATSLPLSTTKGELPKFVAVTAVILSYQWLQARSKGGSCKRKGQRWEVFTDEFQR